MYVEMQRPHIRQATAKGTRHHLLLQTPQHSVLKARFHATDEEMRSQLASQLLRAPDNKIRNSLEVADSPS